MGITHFMHIEKPIYKLLKKSSWNDLRELSSPRNIVEQFPFFCIFENDRITIFVFIFVLIFSISPYINHLNQVLMLELLHHLNPFFNLLKFDFFFGINFDGNLGPFFRNSQIDPFVKMYLHCMSTCPESFANSILVYVSEISFLWWLH